MGSAILAGCFALAGVGLQQVFGLWLGSIQRRNDRWAARRNERRQLYAAFLAQARRVQRIMKDSAVAGAYAGSRQEELRQELGRLSEVIAEIRLIAPAAVVNAVLRLEDEIRGRSASEAAPALQPLPLGPVIALLHDDLESIAAR